MLKSSNILFFSLILLTFPQATALSLTEKKVNISWQQTREIAQKDEAAQAERLFNEGMELYKQLTAESRQQAIQKWEEALPFYKTLGDKSQEAETLYWLGYVYDDLGERQKALDYYNQALPIFRATGDRSGEATTLTGIGAVYDNLGERQKALDYYNQALPLSRATGDRSGEVTTLTGIGLVYSKLGEPQKALDYYNQALPLSRATGDHSGEATTLTGIGAVYDNLGERQKALDYYNQALPIFRATGDCSGEARTLTGIGGVCDNLGERQKALDYYNQALPIFRATGDRSGEAVTLNNIGAVYHKLGEPQKALDYYNQALPIYRATGDRYGEARTLTGIGAVYDNLGEPQKALDYYNQALPILRATGDRYGEAATLTGIGGVYDKLGERQKALDYYNQALPIFRATGARSGEAVTLTGIGGVYHKLGEPQKALDYYNQALPIYRATGDRSGEAVTLNNIGAVYHKLGEPQKALDYYNQALPIYRATGDRYGEADTLNNIGAVYHNLGEPQKALDYYNQVLPIYRATGDRSGEALTLYWIAYTEKNRGNLKAALPFMEDSIKIIEDLRSNVASPELRESYFSTVQNYYAFYIDLLMQLHQEDPNKGYNSQAFNASEKTRARTLLELLSEAKADIRQGVKPELLAQERELEQQLDAIEKRRIEVLSGNPTEEQKTAIEKERDNLLSQYQDIQAQIRAKSPRYAELKYPQPLTLQEVQQQVLDKDTVLLEYSLGQERSYLWVVTTEGMTSYPLPSQKEIEKLAQELQNGILYDKDNLDGITKAASELSQKILAPAAPQLNKKRILVVADGILQYIPFAALSLPGNQEPLMTQYEVVNLPSSSTLATIRNETKERKTAPKTLAIFADPVFSSNDERLKNPVNAQTKTEDLSISALTRSAEESEIKLIRLEGTRQEAEAIVKLMSENERSYTSDFEANLTNATSPQLNQYRIIHFATHGILNTNSPELSGVVMSLVDNKGNTINGFLRLHEIFNLKLSADLVVLSACETGKGKAVKGEGLVGLTRGFMYAGSPRVLVSLWKVNDRATKEMMTRFYRLMLEKKLPPTEALKAAQLQMYQETEWKSPYYWAAFTLQGEWR
ncbi:CHAT domain-containing tetratricopeptide repeat protein [Gloeothece verrucosa]|uniref:TPR repeat-containing protein n=1 Tax=Gloeothece verrucosa (strain PCC 7822) TaxID=497965 RepID=E0UFD0_GLOV7|nr:CHAT domain-containing tetratricopeptide repeat protein [Gloeothece verrucosa]ADN15501.1 TPR repeat-containing protein [Gloeothece verrucosa PCC 7822]